MPSRPDMRFHWIGQDEDGESVRLRKARSTVRRPEHADDPWLAANEAELRTAVFLDTETTGLDIRRDTILEIALRSVRYDPRTGELISDRDAYAGLQDPGRPLSAKVKQITGFDEAMLKGHAIDWAAVDALLAQADIVVAHNASFDRPMVEKKSTQSAGKVWGCTRAQIDWLGKGFGTEKLDLLCIYHGFFIDSHRAINDVDGMVGLVALRDAATGRPYFAELLENARRTLSRVAAHGAPFEGKDLLKERGYSWDLQARVWHRTLPVEDLPAEREWLAAEIYKGPCKAREQILGREDTFKPA